MPTVKSPIALTNNSSIVYRFLRLFLMANCAATAIRRDAIHRRITPQKIIELHAHLQNEFNLGLLINLPNLEGGKARVKPDRRK